MAKIGRAQKAEIINRILNTVILILTIALIVVILYPQWQQSKTVKMRLGCDSNVTSTVFFVAEARGFFKDNRIVPEFVFFADSRQTIDALLQGDIDSVIFPRLYSTLFDQKTDDLHQAEISSGCGNRFYRSKSG